MTVAAVVNHCYEDAAGVNVVAHISDVAAIVVVAAVSAVAVVSLASAVVVVGLYSDVDVNNAVVVVIIGLYDAVADVVAVHAIDALSHWFFTWIFHLASVASLVMGR